MVGVRAYRIAAIGGMHAKRRAQRFVLSIQTDALLVAALHFLQEQQVGAQSVQAQTQVRQRFTTARCRTAFVNVVAYDPDNGHGHSFVAPATLLRYCAGGYAAHAIRYEGLRVVQECVRTFSSRGSSYPYTNNSQ